MELADKLNQINNILLEDFKARLEVEKSKLFKAQEDCESSRQWVFLQTSQEREKKIKRYDDIAQKQYEVVIAIEKHIESLKEGGI